MVVKVPKPNWMVPVILFNRRDRIIGRSEDIVASASLIEEESCTKKKKSTFLGVKEMSIGTSSVAE